MQKSSNSDEIHCCTVTDPEAFVAKLQKQRGRTVQISPDMRGMFDDATSEDVEPCKPRLTAEGRKALRTRVVACSLELQSVIREAAGVYDLSTPRAIRSMIALLGDLERAIGAHIDAGCASDERGG